MEFKLDISVIVRIFKELIMFLKKTVKLFQSEKYLDWQSEILKRENIVVISSQKRKIIIKATSDQCVSLDLFSFGLSSIELHPYYLTAKQIIENDCLEFDKSYLKKWFDIVRPQTATEILGLNPGENNYLDNLSAECADFPWRNAPNHYIAKKRSSKYFAKAENQFGVLLEGKFRWEQIGPISSQAAMLEFDRIKKIINSVQKYGYDSSIDSDLMTAELLFDKHDDYRVNISSGQHRFPVLVALGYNKYNITIKPNRIHHRNDVMQWPAVLEGKMTKQEALIVFDRVFNCMQPRYLNNVWFKQNLKFGC